MSSHKVNNVEGKNFVNDSPGVLVLTPELLQKLGINLGNIQSKNKDSINPTNEGILGKTNESVLPSTTDRADNETTAETSILKTANLMKESVLLSPTFSNNEILTNANNFDNSVAINQKQSTSKHINEQFLDLRYTHKIQSNGHVSNANLKTKTLKSNKNLVESKKDKKSNGIYNAKYVKKTNTLDSFLNQDKNSIVDQDLEQGSNAMKKIDVSLICSPRESVLLPVQQDTEPPTHNLIKNKTYNLHNDIRLTYSKKDRKINNNSSEVCVQNRVQNVNTKLLTQSEAFSFPKVLGEIQAETNCFSKRECSKNEKNYIDNNCYIQHSENASDLKGKSNVIGIDETQEHFNNFKIEHVGLESYRNSTEKQYGKNITLDNNNERKSLQDLTMCNGFYTSPLRNHIDSVDCKISISRSNQAEECLDKNIITEENVTTSKLCIQGVEKPGGGLVLLQKETTGSVKTYSRSKKKGLLNTNLHNIVDQLDNTLGIDCEYNGNQNVLNTQPFCICKDFGSLDYNESIESYQHIHFVNKETVNCSLEVLLSLYKDECDIKANKFEIKYEISSDKKEPEESMLINNICFNNIEDIGCKKKIDIEESAKKPSSEIKSTVNDNKSNSTNENENLSTLKKRKRSSISDDDKPLAKKAIETFVCGACDMEVKQVNWENHISNVHCFIAWRENESINFEDKTFLEKLMKRLCDTGKLVCTFCKYEHNELKKFVRHVKKCVHKFSLRKKSSDTPKATKINRVPNSDKAYDAVESRVICGVCECEVENNLWVEHISKEHNYLAWKHGENSLDCTDDEAVLNFLDAMRKNVGKFECSNCGLMRKYVKSYVNHVKRCANIELLSPTSRMYEDNRRKSESQDQSQAVLDEVNPVRVMCGVCQTEMNDDKWIDHICKEHNYVAWREGKEELDVNDEIEVYEHLYNLSKKLDGLMCSKCEIRRKYVKSYLTHIKKCTGDPDSRNTTLNDTLNTSSISELTLPAEDNNDNDIIIKCGVCQKEMEEKQWLYHIQSEHTYIAWKEGETAVDTNNQADVLAHLNEMSKQYHGLVCIKCGITRKYVKVFLAHVETCDSTFVLDTSIKDDALKGKDSYECGVCAEKVIPEKWKHHAMEKHYNVAWIKGDYPIDIKNSNAVDNCLKEYKKYYRKLACNLCGLTRVSTLGFYAHIIQCGKTEEEIELFKNLCEICNGKYLCIYEKQHYQGHKEQEIAKERKKLLLQSKLENSKTENYTELTEGRQAAKRARNFIGKCQLYEYNCSKCDFGADDQKEFDDHVCNKKKNKNYSDSEDSMQLYMSSGEESDMDVDSNVSDAELVTQNRKHGDSRSFTNRIKRIPFDVKNPKAYIMRSADEFREMHYTNETLYPKWRECKYEILSDDAIAKYMPPLEVSCQVKIGKNDWMTLNRFKGHKGNGVYTLFGGSSLQCVSWAPHDDTREDGHFLALSGHQAADCPRLDVTDTDTRPNLLQIWDFGDFTDEPKFALGVAHECGVIWSMDWCPSGARDVLPEKPTSFHRLGLLAAACSNGLAYIFSIPFPLTVADGDKNICYLTPVAELRISRGERDKFQATAISWSPERGHSVVLIGYSDGLTALFDLQSESPLLTEVENGIKIFYPYQEERAHNTCITGVSTLGGFPRAGGGVRVASSSSPSGAGSAGAGRLRAHLPCSAAHHHALWPSLLLAQPDGIVNQSVNELDWWGYGQRLGAVHSCCSCINCGVLAAHAPPLLKLMTPHPVFPALNKVAAAYFNMTPLVKKQTKQKTDELGLIVEPRCYEEVVKSYGIEFKYARDLDKACLQAISNTPKVLCHERYPLCDIPSMAFNPTVTHHKRLAIATHSGVVFVISV